MTRVRYGARTKEELEDREVAATSVGAWSTSLTAIYETDPEVVAAVLPPPLEPTDAPLVRVSVASVDLGPGPAAVRRGHVRGAGAPRGHDRQLPAAHADDDRAVGDRRARDVRRAEEARRGRRSSATATDPAARSSARSPRLGTTIIEVRGTVGAEIDRRRRASAPTSTSSSSASPDGKGFDAEPALVYCHREETHARGVAPSTARSSCGSRASTRWSTSRCAGSSRITLSERRRVQRGEIVSRVPAEWLLPVRAPALRRPVAPRRRP